MSNGRVFSFPEASVIAFFDTFLSLNTFTPSLAENIQKKKKKFTRSDFLALAVWHTKRTIDKWAIARQNQENCICAQRRLRSAWASARSDQSICCALSGKLRTQAFLMWKAKTLIRLGGCPDWSVFAGWTCHFAGFVVLWLKFRFGLQINEIYIFV